MPNEEARKADEPAQQLAELSALVDGELDAQRTAAACGRWRDDAGLRGAWHAWHLIGDVLRSDDLAALPQRDAKFVAALRERLAAEPVVLVPPVVAAAPRRRSMWIASSAVAAGFAAVAGTVLVLRQPAPGGGAELAQVARAPALIAAAPAPAPATLPASSSAFAAAPTAAEAAPAVPQLAAARPVATDPDPAPTPATPVLIRDVRLDRYLAAHKQFAGSSALGQSPGYLRAATTEAAPR